MKQDPIVPSSSSDLCAGSRRVSLEPCEGGGSESPALLNLDLQHAQHVDFAVIAGGDIKRPLFDRLR